MAADSRNNNKVGLSSLGMSLAVVFAVHCTVLLMLAALFGYVSLFSSANRNAVLWISLVILIVVFSVSAVFFQRKIYIPMVTIEAVMKLLEEGAAESFLSSDTEVDRYPNGEEVRSILGRLYHSVNRQYSAEMLERQAEFSALQSQINPHFLYNTLESIRGQALDEGMEEIAEMTEALSTFFRYSISKKGDLVSLEDEISNVENYFVIQQYRFDNKFNFSIKYDEAELDILNYMIPKLTIQPIVENSIYHGLETKIGRGRIVIKVTSTEKRLIINISDDGIGMDKDTLDTLNNTLCNYQTGNYVRSNQREQYRHTGIALVNVNARIKLFFGEQYGITVSSTKGFGTDVEVVLPLVRENEVESIKSMGKKYEN